jgi:membrane associated rhomboid family serine protease
MTLYIIIGTSIISILAFSNHQLMDRLKFNAYFIKHSSEGWRFLSYGLVHADWVHLIINMFVLYSFGSAVESYYQYFFPSKAYFYYALLYVGAIAMSVLSSFGKHKDNIYYNAVGASGAVSAVVFASIVFNPMAPIRFIFIPIDIPAFIFGGFYLFYSWYMARKAIDNIGHDAHFWGAIYGIAFTIALKPSLATYFISRLFASPV